MGCDASSNLGEGHGEGLQEDLQYEVDQTAFHKSGKQKNKFDSNKPQDGVFDFQEESNEQFMATKPWVGALVSPTQVPPTTTQAPAMNLDLLFINGFRVEDSRKNTFWSKNKDEVIFGAGAIGVVMNINSMKQRFMGAGQKSVAKGHMDDIISLAVCPKRQNIVTGSLGSNPLMIIWNANTMSISQKITLGRNTRAIGTVRFSSDGNYIICTDKSDKCGVYLIDASSGAILGNDNLGGDVIFDAEAGSGVSAAVATKRGLTFFNYQAGKFTKRRGVFGSISDSAQVCVTYDNKKSVYCSGNINGQVIIWDDAKVIKSQKLHEGSIMSIACFNGHLYTSGSKDNLLKISEGLNTIKSITLPSYAKSIDVLNGKILVTTRCGKMLSIDQNSSSIKQIMQTHWCGQTWGLAIGESDIVYTTGDDNNIFGFNSKTFKVEKKGIIDQIPGKKYRIGGASTLSLLPPNQQSRAVATNSKGDVVFGCNNGQFRARDRNLTSDVSVNQLGKQWIQVIRYSPDGSKVAVGSHDNNIYILNSADYSPICTLKGHNSFITNLDWSKNGQFIQSNCGAYELLFWDVNTGKQITSGATQLRDEKWATYTCKIGWWVQGIFPPNTSGDHVNGVDRNKTGNVIATGDDWGFVNLYSNPVVNGAKCKAYRGHSSHVVRVLFDKKDQYLYSVGGYDKTLMMWKVC